MLDITEKQGNRFSTQNLPIITIRTIQPDDIDSVCQMHQRLSAESVYFRYLQYKIPSLGESAETQSRKQYDN